jgi:RNA polymerase sigma-70 factor (ECF subfamily)
MQRATETYETFEGLVREYQERFRRYAYRLTGNRDDADDLLQQVLLEAFVAFDRFALGSHFDRWVFRIMHHTYLDTVRRRPRFVAESIERGWESDSGAFTARDLEDGRAGPEEILMRATLSESLQGALDALPSDFRSVVALVDLQDRSYEEVATELQCPVGTIRSRLHRARNQMRRSIEGATTTSRVRGGKSGTPTLPAAA